MRREAKKIAIGFTLAVALSCVVFIAYTGWRSYQKHASVELLIGSGSTQAPEMLEADLPPITEDAQRTVFERALGAAENIQGLLDSGEPEAANLEVQSLVPKAIHRIAIGNSISDEDVVAIVRWGWANNW